MTGESSWIIDVSEADFEKEVLERSKDLPVVVDFWAPWCGPCRVLGPTLEKLAEEMAGSFLLAKVNVDEAPSLSQTFQIRGIPAVKAFVDGHPGPEFTGALPEPAVREFLGELIPSEADQLVERAEAPDSSSEDTQALYRKALELEPGHEGARLGLAESLLAAGSVDDARELAAGLAPVGPLGERVRRLEAAFFFRGQSSEKDEEVLRVRLDAAPQDGATLVELGRLLAVEERYEEALEVFLRAAQADRKLAQSEVKELMVKIFSVIGERSELADDYRTKLSRTLY